MRYLLFKNKNIVEKEDQLVLSSLDYLRHYVQNILEWNIIELPIAERNYLGQGYTTSRISDKLVKFDVFGSWLSANNESSDGGEVIKKSTWDVRGRVTFDGISWKLQKSQCGLQPFLRMFILQKYSKIHKVLYMNL